MKIAVCDDAIEVKEAAARFISAYYKAKGIIAQVVQFESNMELIAAFRQGAFKAVFIGINNMSDVNAAWIIRDRDEKCPIIIMSGAGDYSLEGYRLEAFDYLLKPLDASKINKALDRLISAGSRIKSI